MKIEVQIDDKFQEDTIIIKAKEVEELYGEEKS